MATTFDAYHKWLGIPPREQPPNHYRLLGIALFESDPDVIETAADRQMVHVRSYQSGKRSAESQQLLNELSSARVCLLNPQTKAAYDTALRARLAEQPAVLITPPQGPPVSFYVQGALRFFAVHAQRLWIRATGLPAAYWRLGGAMYREGRCREQFPDAFTRMEMLERQLASLAPPATLPEAASAPPVVPRLPEPWWRRAVRPVQSEWLRWRQASVLRSLGQQGYGSDPALCGPAELTEGVRAYLDQLDRLQAELAKLAEIPPGQVMSPQRLALIVAGVVGFFFGFWLLLRVR